MSKLVLPKIRKRHKRLLAEVKAHWGRLALAMMSSFLMAATQVSIAYLIKNVIDDIFVKKDEEMLALMPFVVVGIFLVRGIGYLGQEYFIGSVGQRIIRNLRDALYQRIMGLDLSFFQAERTGGLMSRITWDTFIIRDMVSRSVTGLVRDFFTIVGLIGVVFYRDATMALYAVVILPIAYYPVMYFGKKVRKASSASQDAMSDLSAFLQETFSGVKIVKAFCAEAHETEKFKNKTERIFRLELKAVLARSLSSPIMEALAGVGIALVVGYGGFQVIVGKSTPGTFFSFMAAVLMLYDPVKKLSYTNNSIQEGLAATDRIFDLLETETRVSEKDGAKVLPKGPHAVSFHDVGFSYDTGEKVLSGISLSVNPGEVTALVGASGGGKTTLVNLIPRFFDVTEGQVLIDGCDIKDFTIKSLRRRMAVVTQEPILFNDTVACNIAYGRPDASREDIEAAAKAAFAHDFVAELPKGYDSVIGELGNRLSGGEKQRLAIARAILADAPILILDEATASLDTQSERLVQKALENLMEGRTVFVIAHRLSTIRHANRILVVSGGRIAEEGSHEELIAQNGAYRKLHDLQFTEETR
ncbi:MAG: ATP-binding cassette domain-containing protein [Deltaproteobacteria bacterium]|nr:ATP-binding cassette domain-containing protein [Deltaproteobacteria bacterium]